MTSKAQIPSDFSDLLSIFDDWFSELATHGLGEGSLFAACEYALLGPGKRVRPLLSLLSAQILGIPKEKLRSYALALECVHTFSLVHDDLPALDNDSLRRGRATVHCQYNEATAILVGDTLLAKAFAILATDGELNPSERADLLGLLAESTVDMCEGQMMDLEAAGQGIRPLSSDNSFEDTRLLLESRHLKKTAAIIRAAVFGPALCYHSADKGEARDALSRFGVKLGLLFQVVDDILDATSSTEVLGKKAQSDEARGTPTYVSVYGLEEAVKLADELSNSAKETLIRFAAAAEPLCRFTDFVRQRVC